MVRITPPPHSLLRGWGVDIPSSSASQLSNNQGKSTRNVRLRHICVGNMRIYSKCYAVPHKILVFFACKYGLFLLFSCGLGHLWAVPGHFRPPPAIPPPKKTFSALHTVCARWRGWGPHDHLLPSNLDGVGSTTLPPPPRLPNQDSTHPATPSVLGRDVQLPTAFSPYPRSTPPCARPTRHPACQRSTSVAPPVFGTTRLTPHCSIPCSPAPLDNAIHRPWQTRQSGSKYQQAHPLTCGECSAMK